MINIKKPLVILLIIIWIFSGWPRLGFDLKFKNEIPMALAGSQTFSATTTGTTFVVPGGVTTITVKVWGAGGGGGGSGDGANQDGGGGGGGGFAQGDITVTPGESLTVYVGGGGSEGTATGGTTDVGEGAGGGGYSGVQSGSTFLIMSGGGGGGGGGSNDANESGGGGGAGGGANGSNGLQGENATGRGAAGTGATTSAVGTGGAGGGTGADGDDGSGNSGGLGGDGGGGAGGENGGATGGGPESSTLMGGGGGGGGQFGGGGGENGVSDGGGGGGGGSGKTDGLANITTAAGTSGTNAGAGGAAANNTDPDYASPAGNGGGGGVTDNSKGTAGQPGRVVILWADGVKQVAYRWFANDNSTSVGAAAGYNSPIIAPKEGTPIRLRLILQATGSDIGASGTTSKMQVGEKPAGGCASASFSDINGTDIQWADNSGAVDGAALTANSQDPRYSATSSSDAVINQTYNESNDFTNSQGVVDAGAGMLFDFALTVSTTSTDISAKGGKTYCFRAVQAGGGTFDFEGGGSAYLAYPELTIEKPEKIRLRGHIRLRVVRLR